MRKPYRDLSKYCWPAKIAPIGGDDEEASKEENNDVDDIPDFDDLDDDKNENPCGMGAVLENFSKNAFVLMGKGSSMAQTMKEFPAENPDQLMVQSMTLGEDFGTFLKVGIDFVEP